MVKIPIPIFYKKSHSSIPFEGHRYIYVGTMGAQIHLHYMLLYGCPGVALGKHIPRLSRRVPTQLLQIRFRPHPHPERILNLRLKSEVPKAGKLCNL